MARVGAHGGRPGRRAAAARLGWSSVALLLLLLAQLASGLAGLLGASDPFRLAFWAHAVGAYAVFVVAFAKGALILDVLRRRPGPTVARAVGLLLVGLFLAVLASGLVWVTAGRHVIAGTSLVNWHMYLALGLTILLVWHVADRRWIARVPAARDRRAFLLLAGSAVAGLALWQLERALQRVAGTPGSRRRFTGSYERGSFGGAFPATSWLDDDPDPLEPAGWRLVVDGAVERSLSLPFADLYGRGDALVATLDCTGGWYTRQEWTGASLARLLDQAVLAAGAESVEVRSITGYARRFSLGDARSLLVATRVAGAPLAHGHGAPARLVVPGERGFEWVKWIDRIRVLESSRLLQPPLPLT